MSGFDARRELEATGFPVREGPIKGPFKVTITFLNTAEEAGTIETPSGTTFPLAVPVEYLREKLGGNKGVLTDPAARSMRLRFRKMFLMVRASL